MLYHIKKTMFKIYFIDDKGNCFGENPNTEYCNKQYLVLWRPKLNNWCWFWDFSTPVLAQCGGVLDNGQYYIIEDRYYDNINNIGKLPSFIKEK